MVSCSSVVKYPSPTDAGAEVDPRDDSMVYSRAFPTSRKLITEALRIRGFLPCSAILVPLLHPLQSSISQLLLDDECLVREDRFQIALVRSVCLTEFWPGTVLGETESSLWLSCAVVLRVSKPAFKEAFCWLYPCETRCLRGSGDNCCSYADAICEDCTLDNCFESGAPLMCWTVCWS